MADIIDKIGKYFADAATVQQQQQSLYPGASRPTAYRAQLPSSSAAATSPPDQTHLSPGRYTARERQPSPLLRQRLSLQANGGSLTETATYTKVLVGGSFLNNLERQLRDKVRTASKQQRVQSLKTMKYALEKELQDVIEQLSASRAQRQKDAERQLKARLRAEEWNHMMDDEKVLSEIAADARARASQRVVSRASSLKKIERRRSSNSSTSNQSEDLESTWLKLRTEKSGARSALLFPPELAEFEEEGLSLDGSLVAAASLAAAKLTSLDLTEPSAHLNETPDASPFQLPVASSASSDLHLISSVDAFAPEAQGVEWHVPHFADRELFEKLLVHGMLLSSDEE